MSQLLERYTVIIENKSLIKTVYDQEKHSWTEEPKGTKQLRQEGPPLVTKSTSKQNLNLEPKIKEDTWLHKL